MTEGLPDKPSRVYYIDNLRVLLTSLVVVHHLACTYGEVGDWYYKDPHTSDLTTLVLLPFVATNQAFFMGFFFLIAGYFTAGSLARKGTKRFLGDRFLRLGVPLLFYTLVLNPVIGAILSVYVRGFEGSYTDFFSQHYTGWLDVGPMWFVMNLLILTSVFVLVQHVRPMKVYQEPTSGPSLPVSIIFAVALGTISFLVRIMFPIGYWLPGLHLQLAHVTQYLILFAIGIFAKQWNWCNELPPTLVRFWRWYVPLSTVGLFTWVGITQPEDLTPFYGGLHWQSLLNVMWEQTVAVGIILLLLNRFGKSFNRQNRLLKTAAAGAYTVYIIHPLVLIILALSTRHLALHPLAKFVLLAPVALGACFGAAYLIRHLPIARKIL